VAKQLASIMGIPIQRFDMSEYMERHSVSRLIGAPPGYVGYDQGGLLTDAIDQQPHCVLLLDEIEKAHPDLFNILLQVMDNGRLTDHHGKTVDFRNVVLIMTTNAGASDMARQGIGFGDVSKADAGDEAVKKMFSPEFRNRLDAIVPFAYLGTEVSAGWSTSSCSSWNCSWPNRTSTSSSTAMPANGWASAAMTSSMARGRWPG
jgi:ATP-dependent Clp protease ATP-binding subunit ClpA